MPPHILADRVHLFLVSRQLWPLLHAIATCRPKSVLLLHTENESESRAPAHRLHTLLTTKLGYSSERVRIHALPGSDFTSTYRVLDSLAEPVRDHLASEFVLNFTGGTKLLASAALIWALQRQIPAYYLEQAGLFTLLSPKGSDVTSSTFPSDAKSINELDPLDTVEMQLGLYKIQSRGELISLNRGFAPTRDQIRESAANASVFAELFSVESDRPDTAAIENEGDALERSCAAHFLINGVTKIRRNVVLTGSEPLGAAVYEFDLLFVYGGRLWLVDVKDRNPIDNVLRQSSVALRLDLNDAGVRTSWNRLTHDLKKSGLKPLKEALSVAKELGGNTTKIICVRREADDIFALFAHENRVVLVSSGEFQRALPAILAGRPV